MGGLVYHVLNRAVGRGLLFETEADYAAFERVLVEAVRRISTRVVCYCLMPNHWHMVLCAVTWNGMLSGRPSCIERRTGSGAASGGD